MTVGMEGLGAAASAVAVIQITEDICRLCPKYYMAVKGAKQSIQCLRDEVPSLQYVLGDVQT